VLQNILLNLFQQNISEQSYVSVSVNTVVTITSGAFIRHSSFICVNFVIQVKTCSTKSTYDAYYGEIAVPNFVHENLRNRRHLRSSVSDEEEAAVGDSDKVTSDAADSSDYEGQDCIIRCITCRKWVNTDFVPSKTELSMCHLRVRKKN
jgi:preprotein translocase subunit Sec63